MAAAKDDPVTNSRYRYEDAPMEYDRGEGWRFARSFGEVFQDADGSWMLTSPEAASFAQKNPDVFSSGLAFEMLGSPVKLIPIAIDPPDHSRFRKVLDPMLAPRVVGGMEEDLRAEVSVLIDAFIDDGECDLMADLARLFPTTVFLRLFGLPLEDRDQFIGWVETTVEGASVGGDEPSAEVAEAGINIFLYMQGFLEKKRQSSGEDMLSRILQLEGDEAWTEEEILGMCFLFTLAGLDTVTAAIGFMMYRLGSDPDLRAQLANDPELVAPFIEEVIRLDPPAPVTPRVTTREVEVCGVTIPAGAMCQIAIAAANRHGDHGPNPDVVDLTQASRSHLGFGGGIHRCAGSHLARRELRMVYDEFVSRIPDFRIAEDFEPRIVWPSGTHHFPSLPLKFD
jgi:cytochrome P450